MIYSPCNPSFYNANIFYYYSATLQHLIAFLVQMPDVIQIPLPGNMRGKKPRKTTYLHTSHAD